jgi:hypothetical protein
MADKSKVLVTSEISVAGLLQFYRKIIEGDT